MRPNKISQGTLADMLLMFLATNGSVTKKALHAPFSERFSTQYYSRTYRRLLQRNLIQEDKVNGRLEVRLTKEGASVIKEMHPDRDIVRPPGSKDFMKKRRHSMFSNTNAVFAASNIVVSGAAKPDLLEMKSSPTSSLTVKMERASSRGVFYSSQELKKVCKMEDGSSEYLYSSRLLGVIILNWNIIFVYNVGNKLIEIYPKREAKTIRAIENALLGTPYICDRIQISDSKTCIVLGTSKSMLVKVFRGNAYGKRTQGTQKFRQGQMVRWKAVHASFELFHTLFSKIYFLSCDNNGARMLDTIKSLYNTPPATPYDDLARALECTIDGTCAHLAFDTKDASIVIPMPIIEFVELDLYVRELKSQNTKADVYGPKYYADVISRCFGTSIDAYFDCTTGDEVPIYKYDDNGYPVGDTYMSGLIPVKDKISQ